MNGWQRLWVVVSVCWAGFWGLAALATPSLAPVALPIAVLPPLALYVLGLAGGWIVRGFRGR